MTPVRRYLVHTNVFLDARDGDHLYRYADLAAWDTVHAATALSIDPVTLAAGLAQDRT